MSINETHGGDERRRESNEALSLSLLCGPRKAPGPDRDFIT